MPPRWLLALLALLATLGPPVGMARTLSVTVGLETTPATGTPGPLARVALHDLRRGDDAFDVGLGWLRGAATAAASWRRTVAAGPIGTLVIDGRAGVDGGGVGAATGARGTIGPVALRLELEGGRRAAGPFAVVARTPATTPPAADGARLTGADAGRLRFDVAAAATWRPDRRWTVELAPRLHAGTAGWSGGGTVTLRRAAVAPELDLSARLDLALGPLARHLAAGVTLHHVPRRAPESRATVWWGGQPGATGPGVEIAWVIREAGAQLTLAGGAGPAWADRPQAYAALALQTPLGDGTAHLGARWLAGGTGMIDVGWARSLDR